MANLVKIQNVLGKGSGADIRTKRGSKQGSVETSKSPIPGHAVSPNTENGVKYEYASQPKYMNYGLLAPHQKNLKTTSHRSRDNIGGSKSPPKQGNRTTESKINLSTVNFVLPSNRQTTNRNTKDGKNLSTSIHTDVYGVKSMQGSLLQSTQNSPDAAAGQRYGQQLYKRDQMKPFGAQN